MKMPKLQTVEMIKCDSCQELHPISECEIVVVKIIKGKHCQVSMGKSDATPIIARKVPAVAKTLEVEDEGTPLYENKVDMSKVKKTMIPPAFRGMFIPPGSEDFEQNGAKERRVV